MIDGKYQHFKFGLQNICNEFAKLLKILQPKQDYTQYQAVTKVDPPYYEQDLHQQVPSSPTGVSRESRICGLKRKTFWIVLVVVLLVVIGAAVGGGVGGSLSSKNSSNNDPAPQTSGSGTATGGLQTSPSTTTPTSSTTSSSSTSTPTPSGDVIEPRVYRLTNVEGGTAIDLYVVNSSALDRMVAPRSPALPLTEEPETNITLTFKKLDILVAPAMELPLMVGKSQPFVIYSLNYRLTYRL